MRVVIAVVGIALASIGCGGVSILEVSATSDGGDLPTVDAGPLEGKCSSYPVTTVSDDCEYVGACHPICGGGLAYRCNGPLDVPVGVLGCRLDSYQGPLLGTVACCEPSCTRRRALDFGGRAEERCPPGLPIAYTCVEWLPAPSPKCVKGSGSGNVAWCCPSS